MKQSFFFFTTLKLTHVVLSKGERKRNVLQSSCAQTLVEADAAVRSPLGYRESAKLDSVGDEISFGPADQRVAWPQRFSHTQDMFTGSALPLTDQTSNRT